MSELAALITGLHSLLNLSGYKPLTIHLENPVTSVGS